MINTLNAMMASKMEPMSLASRPESNSSLDGLAKSVASLLSGALFEKAGNGVNFRDGNNPMLGLIADHMDRNPGEFGKPHDNTGSVRSWRDELGEDNHLDGNEKQAFSKGLESLIKDLVGGGTQQFGGAGGSFGFGAGGNANAGGNFGGGWNAQAGGGVHELLASLLAGVGEDKLDGLLQPTGKKLSDAAGFRAFSPEDKDVLKEVARFMDMHPEEFGKPDGKSKDWMGELSEGDLYMSPNEAKQFQKAIDMVKGEVQDSAKGNSLGGLFPDAEQNFTNGGAGNTLRTDASIAAGNVLSVLTQQSITGLRG